MQAREGRFEERGTLVAFHCLNSGCVVRPVDEVVQ